jgi:signal transduction histidine kinase
MPHPTSVLISRLRSLDPAPMIGCYTPATIGQLTQSLARQVFAAGGTLLDSGGVGAQAWAELALRGAPTGVERLILPAAPGTEPGALVAGIGATYGYMLAVLPTEPLDRDENLRLYDVLWSSDPAALALLEELFGADLPAELAARIEKLNPLPTTALLGLARDALDFSARQHASLGVANRSVNERMRNHEDQTRMIVHDMRAPLHTLLISIKALQRQRFDPESQQELLSVAADSANYLLNLTETVLDSARLETSSWSLKRQPIRLATLVQGVCEPLELAARPGQPQLRRMIAEDVPVVWLDRGLMERVLTNLVMNAIKYTPATGEVVVSAEVAHAGHAVELRVRDSGAGIPPEALDHIFERFYQARADDRRNGTGLGLYFCRLAVEAHGGSIAVQSTVGQGTMFTVLLPLTEEG